MGEIKNRIVRTEMVPIEDIQFNPRNWRIHPKAQQEGLAAVLQGVGWVAGVIISERSGFLLDGHLRVSEADKAGETEIPATYVDLDDQEEAMILATFDPIGAMAATDKDQLEALLVEARTDDAATQELLDSVAAGAGIESSGSSDADAEPQIDRAAELQKEWGTERGQLWQLGEHRLLCGDSTSAEDVARVMCEETPFIMVTDPPYGVEYDPDWRNKAAESGHLSYGARAIGQVANDDRADWSDAYRLFGGDVAYTWSPPGDHVLITGAAIQSAGFSIRAMVVWRKAHFAISRGAYHYQHEPCWYAVRKGAKANWTGDRSQSTVWEINHIRNETGHGTQKPLECMARPMRNHGEKGDLVYDPFVGSGTTIIAAEQEGRRCYAMEITPEYVAVCLQRFKDATGVSPRLESH